MAGWRIAPRSWLAAGVILALVLGVWVYQARSQYVRSDCTTLTTNLTTGQTCFDTGRGVLMQWQGTKWTALTEISAQSFGAVCDGATDDSTALQAALTAASAVSANVFFPPGVTCVHASTLNSGGVVSISGRGKWNSILRYTGSGTQWKPTNGSTGFTEITLRDINLQVTNAAATFLDASQILGSTIQNVRFSWAGGGAQGGIGISANPTGSSMSPFYNECINCYFDAVASAVVLNTQQGTGPPNRWKFIGMMVVGASGANTTTGVTIGNGSTNIVSGTDFYGLDCENQGGNCIFLGANADTVSFVSTTMETANGGTLFSCSTAANRTKILGYTVRNGTIGSCPGVRGIITGAWDDYRVTNSTNGSADLFNLNASGANGGLYLGLGPGAGPDKGLGTVNAGAGYWAKNVQIADTNSALASGTPTGGFKGSGTLNMASSILLNNVVTLKSTGAPTCIDRCGSASLITATGNDSAFTVTLGTSLSNTFVMKFATAYAAAPGCVGSVNGAAGAGVASVASVNATATGVTFNLVGAPANGTVYTGLCLGVTAG